MRINFSFMIQMISEEISVTPKIQKKMDNIGKLLKRKKDTTLEDMIKSRDVEGVQFLKHEEVWN